MDLLEENQLCVLSRDDASQGTERVLHLCRGSTFSISKIEAVWVSCPNLHNNKNLQNKKKTESDQSDLRRSH